MRRRTLAATTIAILISVGCRPGGSAGEAGTGPEEAFPAPPAEPVARPADAGVESAPAEDGDAPDAPPVAPGGAGDGDAEEPAPLFLLFGGDLMLPPQIRSVAEEHADGDLANGYARLLREVRPVRERLEALGSVAFVANLESPTATERREPRSWPPRFNGPPEALTGFRAAGIDAVTLASNHAFDQGTEGLVETAAAVEAAGMRFVGAGTAESARRPLALRDAGPRVLLLNYLAAPPRADPADPERWRVAVLDDRVEGEVRAAADDADVVVVVVHWLGEFVARPMPAWREAADLIARAGADAIVCHGPHVVGPVEMLDLGDRTVPIAWSLGNLVANMGWEVHPGVTLRRTDDSEMRIESREETLAALRLERSAAAWSVTGLWMVPLWVEDNRPLVNRRAGRLREIFPRPMPWCRPDAATGCFDGADPEWCEGRRAMILERRTAVTEMLWGASPEPLAPCPADANPYDPEPTFVRIRPSRTSPRRVRRRSSPSSRRCGRGGRRSGMRRRGGRSCTSRSASGSRRP